MKQKQLISIIIFLFTVFTVTGQTGSINLQQISLSGFDDYFPIQSFNSGQTNVTSITQIGGQNTANIDQTKDVDLLPANQSYSFQQGDQNTVDNTQQGSENSLLNFQLGYITNGTPLADYFKKSNLAGQSLTDVVNNLSNHFLGGTGNTLNSSQLGNSNQLMAIQSGVGNSISAAQLGNNNYLFLLQQGINNQVINYNQRNNSANLLFDSIAQTGENLQLSVAWDDGRLNGNVYSQNGTNLSLTVQSGTPMTTVGGWAVTQTGCDMNIIITTSE